VRDIGAFELLAVAEAARVLPEVRRGEVTGKRDAARRVYVRHQDVHLAPRAAARESRDLREVDGAEEARREPEERAAAERRAADAAHRHPVDEQDRRARSHRDEQVAERPVAAGLGEQGRRARAPGGKLVHLRDFTGQAAREHGRAAAGQPDAPRADRRERRATRVGVLGWKQTVFDQAGAAPHGELRERGAPIDADLDLVGRRTGGGNGRVVPIGLESGLEQALGSVGVAVGG
jgi:hypothetical protein